MSPRISVIIPAYNVAPYIEKCVQSVLNQTISDLEVIIVDDGATDNTPEICDRLAQTDKRIQVIHQENKGLSGARNTGIDRATGDWIALLDSDDWIEPEMYETLLNIAEEYEADIASCKTRNCILGENPPEVADSNNITILDSKQMIRGLLDQKIVRFEVWNKLWKRELIGDVRFKLGQVSEDVYFDRVLFLKANKMVHIDRTLHNYLIQRPGNTLSKFRIGRLCVFDEFDALIDDLREMNDEDSAELIGCIATAFSVTIYGEAVKTGQKQEIIDRLRKLFLKYYQATRTSKYRSFKGKIGMLLFYLSPKLFLKAWDTIH